MASKYKLYVLYGESWQLGAVVHVLERRGYTKVKVLKDWEGQEMGYQRYPRYQALIGCTEVNEMIVNKTPCKIFEVGDGPANESLLKVPQAGYLDTNLFEKEITYWNKVADSELMTLMSEHGIQFDTLVILYSQDSPLPAARVLQLMLYVGVRDVRLMDGGMKKWKAIKLEGSFENFVRFKPDSGYGTLMFTRKHEYICSMDHVKFKLAYEP